MGLETRSVGQGIAQDQPPFCVRVEDFDGLATHAGDHVAWLDGLPVGHVLAGGNHTHHVHGGLKFGQRCKGTQHAGRAAHVELHLVHFRCRLDGNAAGVKRDAFAHQHHRRRTSFTTSVVHHDESQGFNRPPGDRQKCAHGKRFDLFGSKHFGLDIGFAAQFSGRLGEHARCGVVGWPVGPFLGKLHTSDLGLADIEVFLNHGHLANTHRDTLERSAFG